MRSEIRQQILTAEELRRTDTLRQIKESCKKYNSLSIVEMKNSEAHDFACRQSYEAAGLLRITDGNNRRRLMRDEVEHFAAACLAAIHYFNDKSEEHHRALRYREECRLMAEKARELAEERKLTSDKIVMKVV